METSEGKKRTVLALSLSDPPPELLAEIMDFLKKSGKISFTIDELPPKIKELVMKKLSDKSSAE